VAIANGIMIQTLRTIALFVSIKKKMTQQNVNAILAVSAIIAES